MSILSAKIRFVQEEYTETIRLSDFKTVILHFRLHLVWTLCQFSDEKKYFWHFIYSWYKSYECYNCASSIRIGGVYKCHSFMNVLCDHASIFWTWILRLVLCDLIDSILMNLFVLSIIMFYLYVIQTTCVLSLDGFVRSGQDEYTVWLDRQYTDELYMYFCMHFDVLFIHDIYYMSIIPEWIRSGQ